MHLQMSRMLLKTRFSGKLPLGLIWILSAIAIIAVCFYPALRLHPRLRLIVLLVLACAAALVPLLVPPEAKIARFCVALLAAFMVFKMWDLHVGLKQGSRPNFREFLAFVANLYFFVWRKRGIERQPATSKNLWDLLLGILGLVATLGALSQLGKANWSAYPFLFEHTLIATGLFLFVIAEINTFVAITRLLGGYIVNGNDRPLAARTPAEFWRRYNRLVGQFVAGIVGKNKYAYDVWGDTVNIASRLESAGDINKVNISAYTFELVRDQFDCEYRGKLQAKGKGEIDMYFVLRERVPIDATPTAG